MVDGLRALGVVIDDRLGRRPASRSPAWAAALRARWPSSTPACRAPRAGSCCPLAALGVGTARVDGALRCGPGRWGRSWPPCAGSGPTCVRSAQPGHLPVEVTGGPLRRRRRRAARATRRASSSPGLLLAGAGDARRASRSVCTTRAGVPALRRHDRGRDGGLRRRRRAARRPHAGSWRPTTYRAVRYAVEPDASAASYSFAAAVIAGGRVTVEGLGTRSLQGDLAFVDACSSAWAPRSTRDRTGTTVRGAATAPRASTVDLSQTLRHRPDPRGGGRRSPTGPPGSPASASSAARRPTASARGHRAAPAAASTPTRSPTASSSSPGRAGPATVAHLRRPPHGDGVRPARPGRARHRHRRSRLRGQDLPGLLGPARLACRGAR